MSGESSPALSSLTPLTTSPSPESTAGLQRLSSAHDPEPSPPRLRPQQLRVTKAGKLYPGDPGTFEGLVAGPGFSATSAFTSPNALWVPRFAVAHSDITTYTDGRWGAHEYSRWPQEFTREAFHIHCIPSPPSGVVGGATTTTPSPSGTHPDTPSNVLWLTLEPTHWCESNCGVVGVGRLDADVLSELSTEVDRVVATYQTCERHEGWNIIGDFIVACLRNTLDRLRNLPAASTVIISLAAHVQRLALELWGMVKWLRVVLPRVRKKVVCSSLVLDVLGAHTHDPSVAQMLHHAGVPVWLQQTITEEMVVYEVVELTELPVYFSSTPSFPRMLLAKRDLSGALNLPGEWLRAMHAVVRRQLLASQLPQLLSSEDDSGQSDEPPAKRLREAGPAPPVIILQDPRNMKTLRQPLPVQPGPPGPTRRVRARLQKAAERATAGLQAETSSRPRAPPHPSRTFHPSREVIEPTAWSIALHHASPVPQPITSVRYYFAPPFLLDTLVGYAPPLDRRVRYLHQWGGRSQFPNGDALWGDYRLDGDPGPVVGREKIRHETQLNVRKLFGMNHSLPSYDDTRQPMYGNTAITPELLASDGGACARVIWDAYETNWRCELLALDALMMGSDKWPELQRWVRESLVAKVWGGTSGVDFVPNEHEEPLFCWRAPPEEGWSESRKYLQAFLHVMGSWPEGPSYFRNVDISLLDHGTFTDFLNSAVKFYVSTFVSKFHRLPVPPVRLRPSSHL
ncbi:hypothetical protein C8Q76DRAFT_770794 [Earliella scabrosa]|nr:hypothetical protein C8Q76DRAFT_770794 [Earliella scabrosa]